MANSGKEVAIAWTRSWLPIARMRELVDRIDVHLLQGRDYRSKNLPSGAHCLAQFGILALLMVAVLEHPLRLAYSLIIHCGPHIRLEAALMAGGCRVDAQFLR
jgi:hypothetical protein|tara:strand:- start:2851 stop:3159 length:309 start_codon:yes stop_codon:yes gene_type:complete